jgi:arylformamidase
MKIIDISVPLGPNTPTWPGTTRVALRYYKKLSSGDETNTSRLDCDSHTGTHVDAPLHFLKGGSTVEQLPLEVLIGPAAVAHLLEVDSISAHQLDSLEIPSGTKRLLLRTRNSWFWSAQISTFRKDYVALTTDAAQWIVDKGFRLVGIDYLSVGKFGNEAAVHKTLLAAGVIVLEGLNLQEVDEGGYELLCLPLKLVGAEGAPARAVLIGR